MKSVRNLLWAGSAFFICLLFVWSQNRVFAQHLPEGQFHANRERPVDFIHYKADLHFNFAEHRVLGTATIRFQPFAPIRELRLDAFEMDVKNVRFVKTGDDESLQFTNDQRHVVVDLGQVYSAEDTLTVAVEYSCRPHAGMYFQKDPGQSNQVIIHTYGEGGLHANWLPIYNDVNDKFSTEMLVTVPPPYRVVSNGVLVEVSKTSDGEQRFHWLQKLPHANYLIAIYVGEFEKGDLPSAFGTIPMHYWVPKGRLQEGAFAFRNTPKMVEFFSRRFDYRYPWDKYDQVAVPDYSIGAMEHTGVTGHQISVLRDQNAPFDFGPPDLEHYDTFWTAEGTISHELAHHWFGDNLTCQNLSMIWLNESFASYLQMLWDEESLGRQKLVLDRQVALDQYLGYVAKNHIIRPLEYHYFDKPDDIYNTEHTYFKGAIILNMLRNILGDDLFFHSLSAYLHKYEFSNVESSDLKRTIEETSGRNLDWFFDDWVYGGGHPIFEVNYRYLQAHHLIDLQVKQVQPVVKGQDLFKLPVDITIATAKGTSKKRVWVHQAEDKFLLASDDKPLMVSFDGGGALVADVRFSKTLDELVYQVKYDQLAGQIWALRELVRRFPARAESREAIAAILTEKAYWGLRAEAALHLGALQARQVEKLLPQALKDGDYRVRKAAVLALRSVSPTFAAPTLKNVIGHDSHNDVVAAAIVSLAKIDAGSKTFIEKQLGRSAWYDEITIACMNAFQTFGEKTLVKVLAPFTKERFNEQVRVSAFDAWKACDPDDEKLHQLLLQNVEMPPYGLQQRVIALLGELHVRAAIPVLTALAEHPGDDTIRVLAQQAIDEITRIDQTVMGSN